MDPPKTPDSRDQDSAIEKAVSATPHSGHVSSYSVTSPNNGTTRKIVDQHIKYDLEASQACDADDLLQHMFSYTKDDLQIDGNEDAKRVREDGTTGIHLKSYIDLVKGRAGEKSYYHPFCVLANHIVGYTAQSSPRIIFCRNDPRPIRGEQDNTRSPDVVCVSSDHSTVKDDAWKKCKNGPPSELKWEDVLHVFEFKLGLPSHEHKSRKKLQPPVPGEEEEEEIATKSKSTASTQVSSMVSSSGHTGNAGNSKPPAKSKKRRNAEPEEADNKRQKTGTITITKRDWVKQCCRYAIDAMSKVENRTHFISALVAGTHVWICYYDRSGVVYSSSMPINTDAGFYQFILLLMGLNNLSYANRGFCERMQKLPPDPKSGLASWIMKINNMTFTLSGTLEWRRPYGLLGRGTRVFQGSLANDASGKVYAIKTSWPTKNRTSEVIIIDTARERLEDLLKDVKFRADNNIGDDLLDRLPSRHWSEDIKDMSTGVRRFMEDYEVRIHRVIVFDMLFPIYELTDIRDFMQAYRDIFQVHHFLWDKNIHHRDISVGNLMYRKKVNGEFLCGVLNDWDLSKVDGKANESLFRTGTRAFLSMGFLEGMNVVHLKRHDMESAFYVLVWISVRYEKGKELDTEDLIEWADYKDNISLNAKHSYIVYTRTRPKVRMHEPLYLHWIDPISMLFAEGYVALNSAFRRKDEPFDDDTLDGKVTYEKLWEILKKDLPETSS